MFGGLRCDHRLGGGVSRHEEVFRPVSALLASGALALACNADVPRARGTRAAHENGLAFEYDQRVRAITRLPDGYTLQLAPVNARAMNEITVRAQDTPCPGRMLGRSRSCAGARTATTSTWTGSSGT